MQSGGLTLVRFLRAIGFAFEFEEFCVKHESINDRDDAGGVGHRCLLKAIDIAWTASALIGPFTNWSISSFGTDGSTVMQTKFRTGSCQRVLDLTGVDFQGK